MAYDGSIKIDTKLDTSGLQKGVSSLTKSLKKIGVATAAALGSAMYAGMKFESAFAGVKKTVDATDAQLSKLRDGIRGMAKELPTSANEIAGVAEAAGQLGIQTENILAFSKTMTMLGDTTNMTAETAATTLARFANITGMSQDNFDRLGSTIVALGNNFATTEDEIASMGMNIASAGKQVGMTEAQIMGFATALSSVGMEAQAGGTAISKLMIDMQLATETGGKSLQQFANVAGVSSEEFATAFKTDAAGAITKFITGLNDTERHGKSAIAILDEMGISEVRLRDAILRAAGSGDLFTRAISTGSKAWEENTALTKEAEQRYDTLESKLGILKNHLVDLGISVYDGISEPLKDAVSDAIEQLGSLSASIEGGSLKSAIAGIGEAFGSLVSIVSQIVSAVLPPLISILGFLGNNIDSVVVSFTALFVAAKGYTIFASVAGILRSATSAIQAMTLASTALQAAETRGITISALKMKYDSAAVAALSAKQIAVSVLTGKTTLLTAAKALATKAQIALNAAWAANPIGVVIVAVAALTAGLYVLGKAVNDESEEEKEAREEREKYIESINQEIEKSNQLIQQAQELSVKREESKESANAEAYANKQLTDQLFELSEKENKSIGDKLLMKDIVDQLNSSMQGLNLQYNEETGQLSLTREEIYKTIEAKKQLAFQNAAMEFLTESYKKQFQLQSEEIELLEDEKQIKNEILEIEKRMDGEYFANRKDYQAWLDYKDALRETQTALEENADAQESCSKRIAHANDEIEKSYSESNPSIQKSINEIESSWEACANNYSNTSDDMLQAAQAFYTQMESDAGSYGENFMAAWKTAIDTGAFESASSVSQMFAIVLGIMQQGSQTTGEVGGNVPQTFYESFMAKSSLMSTAASEGSSQASESANSTAQSLFPSAGWSAAAGFANGITTNMFLAEAAAAAMGKAAYNAAMAAIDSNSPSKLFKKAGITVPQGMALGISENAALVVTASTNMATDSIVAAKKAIDAHSPSRKFERQVGKTIPQGVALGIKKNSYEVTDAVKQMFDDLDLQKEIGALSEAEYYEKLAEYRDKYLEQGTKEWWEYTKKILDYDEKMVDQQFKNLDWLHDNGILSEAQYYQKLADLRDEYFSESDEEWKTYTEKIADYYMGTISDVQKNLEDAVKNTKDDYDDAISDGKEKLSEFFTPFQLVKTEDSEGNKSEYFRINDYFLSNRNNDNFYNAMMNARGALIRDEKDPYHKAGLYIYNDILNSDMEEAYQKALLISQMSEEQLIEWLKSTSNAIEKYSANAQDIYGAEEGFEFDKAKRDFSTFKTEFSKFFEGLPENAYNFGTEFFSNLRDSILPKIESFASEFAQKFTSGFNMTNMGIAGNSADSYSIGGDTYNFYSSNSTVTEQLKAAENQSVKNRLRGVEQYQ